MKHVFAAFFLALTALILPRPAHADAGDRLDYVVQRGDTLVNLARRYFISPRAVDEVRKINRVRNPRRLPVASRLTIPHRLLRTEPVELRVLGFSGPASLRLAGRTLPALRDMAVGEGAELLTGANGFLTLQGSDGSRISLPSNSRVKVLRSRRFLINAAGDIEIEVLGGRADISAAPQQPQGRFRLRTPVSVSAVRGTVFRVAYEADGAMSGTEVLEGHVAVATPVRGIEVPGGFGAAADRNGGIAREALLAPPQPIDPARVQTAVDLTFALRPLEGARSYRLQLGKDAGFVDIVGEAQVPEPEATLPGVANGNYFVRATAIAASGLEGMPDVWTFRRQRVGMTANAGPSRLKDGYRFNWRAEGEGTSLFRFQLYPDGEHPDGQLGAALVDEAGLTEAGITLTALKRGAYQWRVGVIQTTAEGSAEVWTPLQKFTVSN